MGSTGPKPRLDRTDLEILAALEENARIPWRQLAAALGISEASLYRRLNKLERLGVLEGYSAVLNYRALGMSGEEVILVRASPSSWARLEEELPAQRGVVLVERVTGEYTHSVRTLSWHPSQASTILQRVAERVELERATILTVAGRVWRARSAVRRLLE